MSRPLCMWSAAMATAGANNEAATMHDVAMRHDDMLVFRQWSKCRGDGRARRKSSATGDVFTALSGDRVTCVRFTFHAVGSNP